MRWVTGPPHRLGHASPHAVCSDLEEMSRGNTVPMASKQRSAAQLTLSLDLS